MSKERNRTMKRVLLTLLAVILVLGLFAAIGYTGYRFGYVQGVQATANGQAPELRPFDGFGPRGMRMHDFGFERGFHRGFGPGVFPMRGFGFFSPLMFLGRIAVLALIAWFVYWLFTRSGWQLTRTRTTQTTETQSKPAETDSKE
jgi:uncharacterized membrane protein